MTTTPRFPEQLLPVDHSGRMPRVHADSKGDPLFIDFTGPLGDDEAINVDELVRRYNLHGPLVDELKRLREIFAGYVEHHVAKDNIPRAVDNNEHVVRIDALLQRSEVTE